MCKICKNIHPHIISNNIDIEKSVKELFNNLHALKEIIQINTEVIKYRLSFLYLNDIKYNQFNGYLYEILCEILKIDLKKKKEDILFEQFNNKKFNKYYSKLIKDASEGNTYSLNCLDTIKSYYQKKNVIEFKINYDKINNKQYSIRNFIDNCKLTWMALIYIHKMINYDDKLNNLRITNNNLKIKIDEINTKLLINNFTFGVYKENSHNLLCRFLSEKLIQSIIAKYPNKLDKISLNLNIFIDLFSKSDFNILSDKIIINSILGLLTDLNETLLESKNSDDKSVQKELKEKIIEYINSPYNISFIDDIIIGEDIFKKEELNKILDILFFIKNKGNITAHPNIDLNKILKLIKIHSMPIKFEIEHFYDSSLKENIEKEINKKFESIEDIYDDTSPILLNQDESIYYKLNNVNNELKEKYNIFQNIKDYRDGAMNDIIKKITEIRDDILSRFNIPKIKKEVKAKDIIETIFEGKDDKIIEECKDFQRIFISNTDDVIKRYLNMDIDKKLSEENNNINQLIKTIKEIKLILENFIELNIPKHNNLEVYASNIINNTNFDYSLFNYEINKLEKKILKELDMELDCENNEIIVELYFLLMINTYENEKKLLKEIKKKYETELIKIIINEEIEQKLNEIQQKFEKNFSDNPYILTKAINDNFFSEKDGNKITYDRVKYILNKILDDNISLGE